jgi:guanylate kinase
MNEELNKGAILVISGPSGCGKSSLLKEVYKQIDNYYFSISTTTREPRDSEKDGVDYLFVTKEEFEKDIKNDYFLEYAKVHNNYYGTSIKPITKALNNGKLVIFDIDVQGQRIVKDKLNDITTSVFITTPTLKELEKRLIARGTDNIEIINNRIKNARTEIEEIEQYDYFIVNDDLQKASKELTAIAIVSQKKQKLFNAKNIVSNWKK